MGWDAYIEDWNDVDDCDFKDASNAVVEEYGMVDCLLADGGLDISDCGRALERATGIDSWDPDGWDAETVKRAWEHAVWPEEMDMYTACAREFLRVCAENNKGITFSW